MDEIYPIVPNPRIVDWRLDANKEVDTRLIGETGIYA
jgi:hypothetical protein